MLAADLNLATLSNVVGTAFRHRVNDRGNPLLQPYSCCVFAGRVTWACATWPSNAGIASLAKEAAGSNAVYAQAISSRSKSRPPNRNSLQLGHRKGLRALFQSQTFQPQALGFWAAVWSPHPSVQRSSTCSITGEAFAWWRCPIIGFSKSAFGIWFNRVNDRN